MAGVVHLPWYATGFRGDALAEELADIAAVSLRYGATAYDVYRNRDDRYKFLQTAHFEDKVSWERYWEGPEFTDFRIRCSGWFQIPVVYSWTDLVATGAIAAEPGRLPAADRGGNGELATG